MKAERFSHEQSEGPSRHEIRIRRCAEELGHSIGVLEDTKEEFSFQVLNDTYDNMDEAEYTAFLNDLWELDDVATAENSTLHEDPQHGLYIKVRF